MLAKEVIHLGAMRLTSLSGEDARLEAEALLRTAWGLTRAQLYARLSQEVPPATLDLFQALLDRRLAHEPISYLRGHKEFYGLEFRTDRRALIPRPETERLVELALAVAHQRQVGVTPPPTVREGAVMGTCPALALADVGTGCGCIAVVLAAHLPTAIVYATDVSAAALDLARENATLHGLADRITFLQGNLLVPLPAPVDLIVANLPYVSAAELAELPPDIAAYEPLVALDGGPDGLHHIRRLLTMAPAYLRPGGAVLLEIGWRQGEAVVALAREHLPKARVTLHQDYGGRDRVAHIELIKEPQI